MRAIDTNLIVRYLTGDDGPQTAKARDIIEAGEVFISLTVLLEVDWVLRSVFGFTRQQIVTGLRQISGLPGITVEAPLTLQNSLDWTENGLSFADALHLASAEACDEFITFDKDFARQGEKFSGIRMVLL